MNNNNNVFNEVIETCNNFVQANPNPDKVEIVGELMVDINPYLSKIKVTSDNIPFGRYLIHMDKNELFNIQAHVFSKNYTGSIHRHETWGMLTVIQGLISVRDWVQGENSWDLIRYSLISPGTASCFCPPTPDWHATDTSKSNSQAISIHIYGKDWNMEKGIYANPDETPDTYIASRGPLQDNSQLLPYLTLT